MFTETSVFTKQTNIDIIMFTETSVFTKKKRIMSQQVLLMILLMYYFVSLNNNVISEFYQTVLNIIKILVLPLYRLVGINML